jgi:protein involved in polysaccharide export with SLBB domain
MRRVLTVLALLFVVGAATAQANEYIIGVEDVLEVRFWPDGSLNTQVKVGQDSSIVLDIIGKTMAAGTTAEQLQSDIVRQMNRLNKQIAQVVVRVMEYNSNHVFVTGEVRQQGKKAFEKIPDLWTVIKESGGPTEIADLTRVVIIRGGDESGKVEIANVARAIAEQTLDQLPEIRRTDVIDIPQNPMGLPSADLGSPPEERNLVYVLGAVNRPGPMKFEENMDIMEALAMAGGPTENAKLNGVKLVTKDGFYAQALEFDLRHYVETGTPARYVVRKEDAIYVPSKSRFFQEALGYAAGVAGVVTSILFIWDRLDRDTDRNR